jgi:predicted Zn-dependent protease with MMP-like domain
MECEEFEDLLVRALSELPLEFQDKLENVDIIVEERPSREQLLESGLEYDDELLGLYEGLPHTERTRWYHMVLPDRITLFQEPIEAKCRSKEEVAEEIRRVLCHEIAHHFGIDDDRLDVIENEKA